MRIKNLLDDVKQAVSIAQAGIKGTLESLKKTPSQAKKRPVRTRNPKKKVTAGGRTQPKPSESKNGVPGIPQNSSSNLVPWFHESPASKSLPGNQSRQIGYKSRMSCTDAYGASVNGFSSATAAAEPDQPRSLSWYVLTPLRCLPCVPLSSGVASAKLCPAGEEDSKHHHNFAKNHRTLHSV